MTARTRRVLLGVLTGLAVALVVIALRSTYLIESVELKTLDARFRAQRDAADADTSIIIVDVDNMSLDLTRESLGRFPWPRDVWAIVTDYLAAGGAAAIAYDFVFPEPNLNDPLGDAAFAESAARAGVVVQSIALQRIGDSTQVNADFREDSTAVALLLDRFGEPPTAAPAFQLAQLPYGALLAASKRVGVINFTPDPDGTARRLPLRYNYRGASFPSLGLAAALTADSSIDASGDVLLNWRGEYRDAKSKIETYRVIPVAQIFRSYEQTRAGEAPEVPLETFANKIVVIGASASGLFEARANPFAPADPGVMIHATVADNVRNGDFLRRASTATNIIIILVVGLITALMVALLPAAWMSALAAITLAIGYVFMAAHYFALDDLWIDIASPTLAVLLTFTGGMTVSYMTEGRQKKQIRDMFSKYVAPEYVAQLAEDPTALHLEGRRAELSVLFSDIRGFTSISEKLEPPQVIAFLNEYLDEMAAIVKDSGGTLDKFIGDAVMAFWGEPIRREDHADRACDCALAMRDATIRIADRFESEGKPRIAIGIGVNTADVVVGNIGSLKHKLDYTVIGDGVNLASRLEGLNKDFATTIIISEFTRARIGDRFDTRPLGGVNVKGKAENVQIFELLGRRADAGVRG
jgi:adenylate cyclase